MIRKTKTKPMKEILYRASRVAKALGDPAKYAIIDFLIKKDTGSVSEIAQATHRHIATVSYHLAKLKALEIVRYEVKEDGVYYWIKYPDELKNLIRALTNFVKRTLKRVTEDV